MTTRAQEVDGLLLCLAGGQRLAIMAKEVDRVDAAEPDRPYAGRFFREGAPAQEGARMLRHEATALVVDAVDVTADRFSLLPVPYTLARTGGACLRGFVVAEGGLWPVVELRAAAAFLADACGAKR